MSHLHNYFYEPTYKRDPRQGWYIDNNPREQSDQKKSEYVALSYCWGNPARTHSIALNVAIFWVTTSLLEALQALQAQDRHSCYWADAICINQADIEERNAQVQQMWRVYRSAKHVIAFLGPEEKGTEGLFALLRKYNPQSRCLSRLSDFACIHCAVMGTREECNDGYCILCAGANRKFADALAVLGRTYFERTWIIPELLQARKILVAWGSFTVTWNQLKLVTYLQAGSVAKNRVKALGDAVSEDMFKFFPNSTYKPVETLLEVLATYDHSSCSDPRDRVFALLSDPRIAQFGDCIFLRVDYSLNLYQVYLQVLKQMFVFILRTTDNYCKRRIYMFQCSAVDKLVVENDRNGFATWLLGRIRTIVDFDDDFLLCEVDDGDQIVLCQQTNCMDGLCEEIRRCFEETSRFGAATSMPSQSSLWAC